MKKFFYILFYVAFICIGCQFKSSSEDNANKNGLVKIERYDCLEYRYLTTGDFSALQQMNTEYPIETRTLIENVLKIGNATDPDINTRFLKFYQDTTLQSLISAVESKYVTMDDLERQFGRAFKQLKHVLPEIEIPKIYAQISALDQSVIVGNGSIGISLDKYLGEDYPLYRKFYSTQQRKQMTKNQILSDCLTFYLMSVYQLKNFERRPQVERDLHIGKIQWVVNQVLQKRVFTNRYVNIVENYMHNNTDTSYDELLKMTDFSKLYVDEE